MCGILGYVARTPPSDKVWLEAQRAQFHRGPDYNSHYQIQIGDWHLGFAHQRLSILDLTSAANQPKINDDYALIYNGEIYNYQELKSLKCFSGMDNSSKGDTEILFGLLQCMSVDEVVNLCDGMWAFAWLDKNARCLTLSRDPFGEKPLYWMLTDQEFYFSSELKTLLLLSDRAHELNFEPIHKYLVQSQLNYDESTFFKNIFSLSPATNLHLEFNGRDFVLKKNNYWSLSLNTIYERVDINNYASHVRDVFFESVKRRLRSDVPVGIMLSGGLDSSAIASAAQETNADYPITLISAISGDVRFDETKYINIMGKYLQKPIEFVRLDSDPKLLFDKVEKLTYLCDTPIGSLSNIAQYDAMQRASELGVKVILSGQGGDELFCGYKKYLAFYIQELIRDGKVCKAAKTVWDFFSNNSILNQFNFAEAKRYLPRVFNYKDIDVSGDKIKGLKKLRVGLGDMKTVNRQIADIFSYSVPLLNHFEDRISMSLSREIRLPFLSRDLAEIALAAPAEYRIGSGWTKYLLRKSMENYLPAEIAWRKDKQGFSNPQSEWIKGVLREKILDDYFSENSFIFRKGVIDRQRMLMKYSKFCEQKFSKGKIWFREIFNPIALEIWLRAYAKYII